MAYRGARPGRVRAELKRPQAKRALPIPLCRPDRGPYSAKGATGGAQTLFVGPGRPQAGATCSAKGLAGQDRKPTRMASAGLKRALGQRACAPGLNDRAQSRFCRGRSSRFGRAACSAKILVGGARTLVNLGQAPAIVQMDYELVQLDYEPRAKSLATLSVVYAYVPKYTCLKFLLACLARSLFGLQSQFLGPRPNPICPQISTHII